MPDKKTVKMNGKDFEVPKGSIYCAQCGTTNYIYDDMPPPYSCDQCKAPLNEADMTEVDMDELQYEHEEGKYDGQA